ncbi:MAG: tRNA (adenosine(37)-N6)-threonylcarbamoyltransferase complex dimerization subunit type 1 TsaB [Pseudomonadota bacterium]
MNILAVDTASRSCSVAVLSEQRVLSEISILAKETHSIHLMEMVESAVRRSGVPKQELDGYAVTMGPGSFTGLRIGISTMKGFAEANGKPLVGVSSLDALVLSFSFSSIPVCSMLDAGRGEVYFAVYCFQDGVMKTKTREMAASPLQIAADLKEKCLFVGDGSETYRETIRSGCGQNALFSEPSRNSIRAAHVAVLGIERMGQQDIPDMELIPHYIRKCDAEHKMGH